MWSASDLDLIARAFPPHVVNILGRLEQRMLQSGETKEEVIAEIRAGYERSLLDDEHIPPPPRDELQEQIDLIRWVMGSEPEPSRHNFPVNMTEKLSAYDEVGGVPEDLAQLVTGDETLAQAVERMTPGIDELLDMAQALSNVSLEKAIATIDPERSNDWMERIFAEKARLRLKRGTEEENLDRENLLNRTAAVFGKVGAKR